MWAKATCPDDLIAWLRPGDRFAVPLSVERSIIESQ
jgi:hypothetical protein